MLPTCVLVANRGEIVSRVARTARSLGILTAAIYTDSDRDAPYLDDADVAIALGPDTSPSPYLDAERLVAAAREAGADAVHPGYGFLAENAAFASAVIEAGLLWIGPSPDAISAMGRKVEAKELARRAGVPVLDSVTVTDDLADAVRRATALPVPVLVKPSAGGGGKGMVVVREHAALPEALERSRREAASAFGDGTLFIEAYLEHPRHVEVQLMGDSSGRVLHLGERDCSVQRRHQKIIEESPAPSLPRELRDEMCLAAVRLAESIGYQGAGTVEFLYDAGAFYFLEMNTRLQVEHAVTEEVTGLDLVALQFRVAAGQPIPFAQDEIRFAGHAIQARLYAEDPARDFLPSPGFVHRFEHPQLPGLRWEDGVRSGASVSTRFDPMVSKVIARGADRDEAAGLLTSGLRGLEIDGVQTNRELLVRVLGHPDFRSGLVSTDFLERHADLLAPPKDPPDDHAVAATLYLVGQRRAADHVHAFAPPGWRNLRSQPQSIELQAGDATIEVGYTPARSRAWTVTVDSGDATCVEVHGDGPDRIDLSVGGRRRRYRVSAAAEQLWVSTPDGRSTAFVHRTEEQAGTAGGVGAAVANLPGVVVAVRVAPGDAVRAGDPVAAIESMKMEHVIRADGDGIVTQVHVRVGDNVESRQVLVTVEAADER